MKKNTKHIALMIPMILSFQVHAESEVVYEDKQDLVGLFQFFEDQCGYGKNNVSNKELEALKDSLIGYSDEYYVKPLSNLPSKYRKSITGIELIEDSHEVMHYIVSFKNATYRGYDLDKLDISFIPYSEYDYYDHLYFKDISFLELKPLFEFAPTNSGWAQTKFSSGFNRDELSITCEGMDF